MFVAWAPGIGECVHCWLLTSRNKLTFPPHKTMFSCNVQFHTGLPAILTLDEARHSDLPDTYYHSMKTHLMSYCSTTRRYSGRRHSGSRRHVVRELNPEAADRLFSDLHTVDSFNGLPHASLLDCCNFQACTPGVVHKAAYDLQTATRQLFFFHDTAPSTLTLSRSVQPGLFGRIFGLVVHLNHNSVSRLLPY